MSGRKGLAILPSPKLTDSQVKALIVALEALLARVKLRTKRLKQTIETWRALS